MKKILRVLCPPLLLSSIALAAEPVGFEKIGQWVSQGQFKKAAEALQEVSAMRPDSAEEKILRGAIGRARTFLNGQHPIQERDAARQALCRLRFHLPEELPGSEEPLHSMGGPGRPELIGKATAMQVPEAARRAGIQGTVIVEAVIDQEGCVRRPRILKGLPMGIDSAALAAVRSWTFRPGMLSGRPVAVYYVVTTSTPPRK